MTPSCYGLIRVPILKWPRWLFSQRDGGFDGPVGLAEHFAGEQRQVGFAAHDDLVGLMRVGYFADGSGGDFPAFSRIEQANGTWKPGATGIFAYGTRAPLEQSMRSTPRSFMLSRVPVDRSDPDPPSTQSVAEMRTKSGIESGIVPRIALTTQALGESGSLETVRRIDRCGGSIAGRGIREAGIRARCAVR